MCVEILAIFLLCVSIVKVAPFDLPEEARGEHTDEEDVHRQPLDGDLFIELCPQLDDTQSVACQNQHYCTHTL